MASLPRRVFAVAIGVTIAASFGVVGGGGSADATTRTARASGTFSAGRDSCDLDPVTSFSIGKVTMTRHRNSVTFKSVLKGADPSTQYDIDFFEAAASNDCTHFFEPGTIWTDADGRGNGTFTVKLSTPTDKFFMVDPVGPEGDNNSPFLRLK